LKEQTLDEVHVVKKGYTVSVTSWENDGDNYATNTKTYDDKEYALAVLQLCKKVFASCNNGDGGVGNMNDGSYEGASEIILKYVTENPTVLQGETDPERFVDIVMDINYYLMGSCEYYYSRVFDNGFVFYSPEDVKCEKIESTTRFK
jgi:hypothetical protein